MLSSYFRSNLIANPILRRAFSTTPIKPSESAPTISAVFRNITKDRTKEVPVETSVEYLKSDAYKQTYGGKPVWVLYRRNHKGSIPPRRTRRTCIRQGQISTGNPCPICRDEYLVLNETNIELLNQFICPHTQVVLDTSKTGLCRKSHQQLLVAIDRARDKGLITFDVPFRKYNYSEYK
ncbi:small ribosomal subunit protein mS40 [Onthophagus taurus]|uniref:small ribosomal subunit protein mS40 n=1 Tax=Onthophagus taurus TaxID=166361 RepID=UPI000C2055DE|nr:28S ribosomal protein S18b, mitochondrial [Onthophagus taurus]